MATIRMTLLKRLYDHGLFEDQAEAVLEMYLKDPISTEIAGRIDDDLGTYPPNFIVVVWIGVKRIAVKWIDENMPKHWAREMFTNKTPP